MYIESKEVKGKKKDSSVPFSVHIEIHTLGYWKKEKFRKIFRNQKTSRVNPYCYTFIKSGIISIIHV